MGTRSRKEEVVLEGWVNALERLPACVCARINYVAYGRTLTLIERNPPPSGGFPIYYVP